MGLELDDSPVEAPRAPYIAPNMDSKWLVSMDQMRNTGDKTGIIPMELHGNGTDTSKLTDQTKLDMQKNMLAHYLSLRTGHPTPKEAGADGTYKSDGGEYTQKDGRVTELKFANGKGSISDIKFDENGRLQSATMQDGSRLEQNIVRNKGFIDGWHQDGFNLIAKNGSVTQAPYTHAFADSSGFSTMTNDTVETTTLAGTKGSLDVYKGGEAVSTDIKTAGGEVYRNIAYSSDAK